VWLNGEFIGNHEGGYTPFRFLVGRFDEENVLAVLVEDSRSAGQVRGKQTFLSRPFMVWYTGCTGIWQPVWIEPVGRVFIDSLRMKRSGRSVVLSVDVRGHETGMYNVSVSCSVYAPQVHGAGRDIAKNPARVLTEHTALDAMKKGRVEFTISEKTFTRWDVGWPAMHPVEVTLHHEKKVFDTVHALYGLRDLSIEGGAIRLNGKPLYQRLLLNQGYYPAGLYTPEGPEMFKTDIELMKRAGFNGCRMHQKIEHPAFLYWADLLGFLVWEEMPSYYTATHFTHPS
jgi:beta-galactosidase/beta-glucuronidase